MRDRIIFLVLFALIIHFSLKGQGGDSPYTFQGIGEIIPPEITHTIAMGGVGISNGVIWHLNTKNPALLARNSLTVFEMAGAGDFRKLVSDTLSRKNASAEMSYLAFGFPIKSQKWTLSLGYGRFSNVNYSILTSEILSDDDVLVNTKYDGSGGLSNVYVSNGFRIGKLLALGIKASYFFGPITNETTVIIDNNLNNQMVLKDRVSFSDVNFGLGLAYIKPLKDNLFLNFGLNYDLEANISGKRLRTTETRIFNGTPVTSDTLVDGQKSAILLPAHVGFGISLEKSSKWTLGMDLELQTWSDYRDFDGRDEDLNDSFKASLGGEITPDITSVSSYLKRITYRLGFNLERTPFSFNNEQITEIGINFGTSLPVSRFSRLNWAIQLGRRGTGNTIKEEYLKIYFGITFNDFAWRKRPIYD